MLCICVFLCVCMLYSCIVNNICVSILKPFTKLTHPTNLILFLHTRICILYCLAYQGTYCMYVCQLHIAMFMCCGGGGRRDFLSVDWQYACIVSYSNMFEIETGNGKPIPHAHALYTNRSTHLCLSFLPSLFPFLHPSLT